MTHSCWFFIFALACCLPQMLAVSVTEEEREGCSAKRCGNLTISDPFWLVDIETGKSCSSGSLEFEVACYNNTPVLLRSFELYGFGIIGITYEEHSLRVVDLSKLELLHAANNCDVFPTWNTSAKLSHPFRIDSGNLELIFYNCTKEAATAARRDRALAETRMKCGNQSEVFVRAAGSFNETGNYAGYAVEGCDTIVVPVSGEANASDYEQLINDGFRLTWDPARKFAHLVKSSFNPVIS